MRKRTLLISATLAAGLLATGISTARAEPDDTLIRMIVGFPPGQAVDLIARVLADQLGHELNKTIVVENKPGQGGSLALGLVARAPADGTVITLSSLAAFAINPVLYKSAVSYDALKDFAPIGLVADIPTVLVTGAQSGITSFPDLLSKARASPGSLTHSSSGNGTVSHLGMVQLKRRAGVDIVHVPYKGSAPAMTDVVAGRVQVGLDSVAATKPLVEGKRLVVLAAASPDRLPSFPNVPTLQELGFPGLVVSAWTALAVPAATPTDVRAHLSSALHKVVSSPEFAAKLAPLGVIPRPSSAEEFGAFLRSEVTRWQAVVAESGLKVE
ncbi:MAG TPA: tripartite tricarboxylate transporter substrate binding protein [Usitatibacter sp.]|jgi:tripartite-type tricarboxylate transporter receptor subunit TctC|nr:tripartite tricarboxylate transporter substrate binding protein [Usitatibacter sp.]